MRRRRSEKHDDSMRSVMSARPKSRRNVHLCCGDVLGWARRAVGAAGNVALRARLGKRNSADECFGCGGVYSVRAALRSCSTPIRVMIRL